MFKEKNNKYGIRKLSVGVGSIVIGLVISSPIYADTNDIKSELSNFVSTKYYGTDTDNDGIIDKYDKDPLKWNVTDRDLRLFTELAYRSSDELTKIFNEDQTAIADFNSAKLLNVTDVSEITSDWHFVKQINHDNGFSASIFSNGRDAVVAIAGTNDANDADDDLNIFNGTQPGQVNNIREIVDELSAYDNYYLTGHSLGGYLAVYLASSYLYNNEHLKHVAVFNAPGIKDSWSWISGNLFHRTTSANSLKLTDKFAAPTISNDEDSRNLSTEGFIQPYGINGDTVAGVYYYGNTRWNDRINSGSKHSSTNFFGTKQDENFKKWFSTGYRLDAPYLSADSDFDGLTDKDELAIGTDLNSIDSDNDGYGDKIELASGTNPLDASSSPKLNEFYYSAVTKGLTFKTPGEIQKNTLLSVAATTLDVYFENYKNQIPVLQSSEVTYSILNEPTDWKEIPGEYDVLLQARYKDNSLSNVFKLPIKIVLNQLRDEYKEKITNLSNLTESEKTDFINELNAVDAATFDEILLAATNLNESRTVAPDNPTTEEPGQPEVPVEQPTEEPGQPEAPVEQPTEEPGQPEVPVEQPTEEPGQPEAPVEQPTEEPGNPEVPVEQPTEEPGNPEVPVEQPTEEPGNPEVPVEQPTEEPGQPEVPVEQPTEEPGNPETPVEQPTEEPGNPETPVEQPTEEPGNPETPVEQPTEEPVQPEVPVEQPTEEPGNPDTPATGMDVEASTVSSPIKQVLTNNNSSVLPQTGYKKSNTMVWGLLTLAFSVRCFFRRKNKII